MTELTILLKDYKLNLNQLSNLAAECFGQPLTEEPHVSITFGFEDAAHSTAFQQFLRPFTLS